MTTQNAEACVLIPTVQPGVFWAPSRSKPSVWYEVRGVGTPFVVCSCPAADFARGCWHRTAALAKGGFIEAVAAEEEMRNEVTVSYKARAWDEEKDGSGEFAIPDVEDGTYLATVKDCEDKEFPGYQGGPAQLKYMIKWEFADLVREDGEPVTLIDFVTIPAGLINEGYLHPKARLFARLKALGFDPSAPEFDVNPLDWIGLPAKIWVQNKTGTKADANGVLEVRPQIVNVTPHVASTAPRRTTATVKRTTPVAKWGDGAQPFVSGAANVYEGQPEDPTDPMRGTTKAPAALR